jgi:hypothetical protein
MQLQEVKQRLGAFAQKMDECIYSLDHKQLLTPEREGKWSIAEVMEHLLLANRFYIAQLQAYAAKSSPKTNVNQHIKMGFRGKVFLWFVTDKIPFKVPAPDMFKPQKGLDAEKTLKEFKEMQEVLKALITKAAECDFHAWKIRSPLSSLLVFNAGALLHIIATHQERHWIQIQRILQTINS